jgi:O-antigen/teichoic acid export membrane protein
MPLPTVTVVYLEPAAEQTIGPAVTPTDGHAGLAVSRDRPKTHMRIPASLGGEATREHGRPIRSLASETDVRGVPWGVIDQALSSGTNFAMALLVAHLASPRQFGVFSLVVIVYVLTVGCFRAFVGEALMIRFTSKTSVTAAAPVFLGLAAVVGIVMGVSCVVASLFSGGALRASLVILGVAFPLLLVQDAGRIVYFALSQPARAALNDGFWAVVLGSFVAIVVVTRHGTATVFIASWAAAGALAGVLALVQLRVAPVLGVWREWLRDHGDLGRPLLCNHLLTTAPPQVLFALTPLLSDLDELGIARVAYLPFGVFGIVLQSAWLLLLPAAARTASRRELDRRARLWSSALAAIAVLWGTAVMLSPSALGRRLVGGAWTESSGTRLFFAMSVVAYAVSVGPSVGLRALGRAGQLVRIRLITGPASFGLGLAVVGALGAPGVALSILVGDALAAILGWYVFRRAVTGAEADPHLVPPVASRPR